MGDEIVESEVTGLERGADPVPRCARVVERKDDQEEEQGIQTEHRENSAGDRAACESDIRDTTHRSPTLSDSYLSQRWRLSLTVHCLTSSHWPADRCCLRPLVVSQRTQPGGVEK